MTNSAEIFLLDSLHFSYFYLFLRSQVINALSLIGHHLKGHSVQVLTFYYVNLYLDKKKALCYIDVLLNY